MPVDPDRTPTEYSALTYVVVIAISLLGGLVKFLTDLQAGRVKRRILLELVMDLMTSAFVGVLTFWACQAQGVSELWTAVCVGTAGHMGTRALALFGRMLASKFGEREGT